MANTEFGTGKTVLILTIVAACFAVLWPKIFYPMLTAPATGKPPGDNPNGCCDVMSDLDINAIKIMTEMCGTILSRHEDLDPKLALAFKQGRFSKEIVQMCRSEVQKLCGIDITELLNEKVRLGRTYRQILDELKSFNISACLRQHFGVNPGMFGAQRRMREWGPTTSRHMRQERPLHLRPEMVHPALREKGRAIGVPQSHIVPKVNIEVKEPTARPPPIPGMRPPMGGAGHVVPAPKGGGTMGIVMPLYTIGIVIFFMYTIMKVFVRKTGGDEGFKEFRSDPEFRRVVFAEDYSNGCAAATNGEGVRSRKKESSPPVWKSPTDDSTRLGWKERDTIMTAIGGLVAEVDLQLDRDCGTQNQYSTEPKAEETHLEDISTEKIKTSKKKDVNTSEQAVIDDTGHVGLELETHEEDEVDEAQDDVQLNHNDGKYEDEPTTNYTTATMSGGDGEAEQAAAAEEDTEADLSNIDPLETAEDQELNEVDNFWGDGDEDDGPPQSNLHQR